MFPGLRENYKGLQSVLAETIETGIDRLYRLLA